MDPNGNISPQDTTSFRTANANLIRSGGLQEFPDCNCHPCGVNAWDPMVYGGVTGRMDTGSLVVPNDLHWRLDKAELL
jgi:hypothetical protein